MSTSSGAGAPAQLLKGRVEPSNRTPDTDSTLATLWDIVSVGGRETVRFEDGIVSSHVGTVGGVE